MPTLRVSGRTTARGTKILGNDIVCDSVETRERVGCLAQAQRYYEHVTARDPRA